jgi:hypothetical protein
MNLSDAQKTAVGEWVEAGAELGEIQTRLKDEFDVSITYLDTRFLLGDLGLELMSEREVEEPEPEEEEPTEADTPPESEAPSNDAEDTPPAAPEDELPPSPSNVSVTVDQIAQPHALISGKVTFSDGKTAGWYLDQMGQLGLDPTEADYRPSEEDIAAFQMELQKVMQQQGY